jgi:hypothetical protein
MTGMHSVIPYNKSTLMMCNWRMKKMNKWAGGVTRFQFF